MKSCIDAYYQYNIKNSRGICPAVTYGANLTSSLSDRGGDCWMKSAGGVNALSPANDLSEAAALETT